MSLKLIKGMESIIRCEVLKAISGISSRYSIDVEDEYNKWELGVSGESVSSSKGEMPLPYSGLVVEGNCNCVKKNRGLYTQCGSVKEVGEMCRRCDGEVKRKGAIFGTMKERSLVGIMEYKDSKGNGPVSYLKVMRKLKLSREEVEGEALRRGVVIDAVHFEEGKSKRGRPSLEEKEVKEVKEVKGKGRPSKSKKVLELEDETVDLFANMVKAALDAEVVEVVTDLKEAEVVEVVTDLKEAEVMTDLKEAEVMTDLKEAEVMTDLKEAEKVVNDKEEKESQKLKEKETKLKEKETKLKEKEEKESQKLKEKEEKESQKLKEKEEKEAQKLKEKEEKESQKLKEKEEKEAQKLKEKEEKEVAKLKEKEAKDAAKDFAPLLQKVDLQKVDLQKVDLQKVDLQKVEVEEEDSVTEFEYEGKKYLRSVIDGTVYDMDEEEIGKWDKELKKIVLSDNNSEEEEEDYE